MFWLKSLFVLPALFFAPSILHAQEIPAANALVESLRNRSHNAGTAVAVFNSKELLHVSTHGYRDIQEMLPITQHSLFMIGSTTKAMTATVAGFLAQENKISWDQRVKDLVPSFQLKNPEVAEQVTLRDLLLHRTGLPRHDFAWLSRNWTSEKFLKILPLLDFSEPFRAKWQYNNWMYMVAGLMISKAGDSLWADQIQELIFNQLSMKKSRPLSERLLHTDELAMPHVWNGSSLKKIEFRNMDGFGPAGSVHSTILDMVQWLQFNLNNGSSSSGVQLLDVSVLKEIQRPQIDVPKQTLSYEEIDKNNFYGFGWGITKYRDKKMLRHGGGIDGFRSEVALLPDDDLGVVVLTNGGNLDPDIVSLSLLDLFLNEGNPDWLERFRDKSSKPPRQQQDFISNYEPALGVFQNEAYGEFIVTEIIVDEQYMLSLDLNGGFSFYVTPEKTDDPNVWRASRGQYEFKFFLDQNRKVNYITANLEPTVEPLKFFR